MNSIHEIAAISFGLTATLLLIIEFVPNKTAKRIAAVLALLGVGVADFYLLADVPEMGPLFTDDGMRSPRRAPPQQAAADEDDEKTGRPRSRRQQAAVVACAASNRISTTPL